MLEITDIRLSLDEGRDEASCLAALRRAAASALSCEPSALLQVELRRRAVDARRKSDVHLICTARVSTGAARSDEALLEAVPPARQAHIHLVEDAVPAFPRAACGSLRNRPVVVGAGCAGLFAALALAEAGLEPLVIERGDDAARRAEAIEHFLRTRELDTESNIQFGLGGAGTFSDGKLTTGTKNPAHRLILEAFVAAQQQSFQSYLPDQGEIADNAILKTLDDGTIILVMSEGWDEGYDGTNGHPCDDC